jgi:hypothetical protein
MTREIAAMIPAGLGNRPEIKKATLWGRGLM